MDEIQRALALLNPVYEAIKERTDQDWSVEKSAVAIGYACVSIAKGVIDLQQRISGLEKRLAERQ